MTGQARCIVPGTYRDMFRIGVHTIYHAVCSSLFTSFLYTGYMVTGSAWSGLTIRTRCPRKPAAYQRSADAEGCQSIRVER